MPVCSAVDPPFLTIILPVTRLNRRSYPAQCGQRHTVQFPSVCEVHWWNGMGVALDGGMGVKYDGIVSD